MAQRQESRRARGFCYPIPVPLNTAYSELGLDPAADQKLLAAAKQAKIAALINEKHLFVPAPVTPARQGSGDGHSSRETGKAEKTRRETETNSLQQSPKLLKDQARTIQVDQEIQMWNHAKAIDQPGERLKYDRKNPPLALLKLQDCGRAQFMERRSALLIIRREVAAFLESKGEQVFHPSDITRSDFSSDYELNSLLDPPERLK